MVAGVSYLIGSNPILVTSTTHGGNVGVSDGSGAQVQLLRLHYDQPWLLNQTKGGSMNLSEYKVDYIAY